jgi:nardilysin
VDPLQQLWAFYNQYYYAANMRLVICSAYSLDTMQRKVLELFGKVPAMPRELGPYPLPVTLETIASWDAPPYASPMAVAGLPFEYGTESYHPMPRIYRIVPVRDRHVLHVTWCLPPVFDDWRSKSFDFIGHLFGHEANGSLLSYLKSKSWATQCMAGIGDSGSDRASSHSLFTLTIILSVDGLKEWKAVIDAIYEYIGMLRLQCRQGWPTYLFDELKTMHDLSYKYRDELPPDELVEGISDDMAPHVNMPPEHLLDGNSLLFEFDPVKVQMLIDEYMTPKQARIDLSSSTFGRASDFSDAALTEGVQTKPDIVLHAEEGTLDKDRIGAYNIEPMFGTIFWCSEVPEDWIQHWIALAEPHTPTIDIKLPLPNPFVPKRFDLKALPDHDSRHPLVNCSLKLCVPVGKKLQWFPATPVQYNKTRNSLLITYEDENEQWHVVDDSSDPAFKSLRVGHEGTLDKKQVKFRVLSVAHPGGCAPRMFGDETDLDVEDGKSFPPIPPSLSPAPA